MTRPRLVAALAAALWAFAVAPAMAEDGFACPERAPADLVALSVAGSPVEAVIAPSRGGEMISLRLRGEQAPRELLYRGGDFCEADGFEGKAPVLWPATGRTYLPDRPGQKPQRGWLWEGKVYAMPVHGFARDRAWRLVGQTQGGAEATVTLELADSAETRGFYPFGFTFQLRYVLRGSTITVEHRIHADEDNGGAMPFSLGNHIAFALPPAGATLTSAATRQLLLDAQARPTGESEAIVPLKGASLAPFTGGPAVPLAGYAGRAAAKLDLADGPSITVEHEGSAPASGDPVGFNMWGDLRKGFFSPEPWWGKQNALATGDGVVRLDPGAEFRWTFTVAVDP